MTEHKPNRGGRRVGAGRPSMDAVRINITLPQNLVDWLKKHGNVSAQIRKMVERAVEEEEKGT